MEAIDSIKNFFGFSRIPFSKNIEVNSLFKSSSFEEALIRLEIALSNEEMALLTGAVGTGKSNLLRFFANRLDSNRFLPIYVPADNFKIGEIAKYALIELKMEVPYHAASAFRVLKKAIQHLNSDKGIKPILIIDEAQELPMSTLLSLKNLLNFHMDSQSYLFVLLAGQKNLLETIGQTSLESLRRRLRIQYELKGLNLEESSAFITHQLKWAGVDRPIFTEDVKAQIFHHSKGIVSSINQICFDLIIYAVSCSKDIIEPSMLEMVIR